MRITPIARAARVRVVALPIHEPTAGPTAEEARSAREEQATDRRRPRDEAQLTGTTQPHRRRGDGPIDLGGGAHRGSRGGRPRFVWSDSIASPDTRYPGSASLSLGALSCRGFKFRSTPAGGPTHSPDWVSRQEGGGARSAPHFLTGSCRTCGGTCALDVRHPRSQPPGLHRSTRRRGRSPRPRAADESRG